VVQSGPMYTSFSWLSIFLFSGIVQALFLALVFLVNPRGSRRASWLLAAFFVVAALVILNGALYQTNLYQDWTFLIGLPQSFQLLVGPVFLWYVRALVGESRFRPWDAVHLLPFVLYLALELSFLFRNDFYKMALMYSWLTNRRDWGDYLVRFWYQFGLPLQLWLYLGLVWRAIRQHEVTIRQLFSTIDDLSLTWLRNVVVAFAVGLVGVTVGDVLPFFGVEITWMFLCAPITDTVVVYYLAGVAFLRRPQDNLPAPRPPPGAGAGNTATRDRVRAQVRQIEPIRGIRTPAAGPPRSPHGNQPPFHRPRSHPCRPGRPSENKPEQSVPGVEPTAGDHVLRLHQSLAHPGCGFPAEGRPGNGHPRCGPGLRVQVKIDVQQGLQNPFFGVPFRIP